MLYWKPVLHCLHRLTVVGMLSARAESKGCPSSPALSDPRIPRVRSRIWRPEHLLS